MKGRLKEPSPFRNYNHFSPGRADMGSLRGTLVPLFQSFPLSFWINGKGSPRGALPLLQTNPPSPLKERGTKGVRLINNLYLKDYSTKGVNGIIEL